MSEEQTNLQLWELQEYLTLHEAACLAVGVEPSSFIMHEDRNQPIGWKPLYNVLCEDINNYLQCFGIEKEGDIFSKSNVIEPVGNNQPFEHYRITQDAFKKWLDSKGLKPTFFFSKKLKPTKSKPKEEKQQNNTSLDFWKLREWLTIDEATFLALGIDPSNGGYRPDGWDGLNAALLEAVEKSDGFTFDSITVDYHDSNLSGSTRLKVTAINEWFRLNKHKMRPTFFFPEDAEQKTVITKSAPEYQT